MKPIKLQAPYLADPQDFFARFASDPDTMLLESAEIVTKSGKQSLLGLSCALKVTCKGRTVTARAENQNGRQLLTALAAATGKDAGDGTLSVSYPPCPPNTDEVSRLKFPGPLNLMRDLMHLLRDCEGIFVGGMIGFDFIGDFEDFGALPPPPVPTPDYTFYVYDLSITVDHLGRGSTILGFCFDEACYESLGIRALRLLDDIKGFHGSPVQLTGPLPECTFTPDLDDAAFGAIVEQIRGHIIRGDAFQVVPSRTFTAPCTRPDRAFAWLKRLNPSPYMFYIRDRNFTLFGASPEYALRYCAPDGEIAISPIAGTRPRGTNPDGSLNADLDTRIELELRTDQKEVAEHLMLVDLARNDLARIAIPGSRRVENLLHVDRYQSVMHLVSDVHARLRGDLDAFHAYQACMNMGTLSGAPKIRAHELIYRYEGHRRGPYGGTVAVLAADGSFDSCITIRSALVTGGEARVQAGCGVTFDSDPAAECAETRNKARSVLTALTLAEENH